MKVKLMMDLFSGLGGASEAFHQRGEWQVYRYENNPLLMDVPRTFDRNVANPVHCLPDGDFIRDWDLIWASPPCREFSNAFGAPGPVAKRNREEFQPDMSLLRAALRIIQVTQPRYWVIENVVGAIRHFSPLLGEPRQIIGPFVLWGNFPYMVDLRDFEHTKANEDVWSDDPLRANKKGKIPLEISEALLNVITAQRQLSEWVEIRPAVIGFPDLG